MFKGSLLLAAACLTFVAQAAHQAPPAGFEDPVLFAKLLKGNVVVEQLPSTKTEFRSVIRAYFNRVSPDAYADLYTSHKKWIGLLAEIKDAKTLSSNNEKTELSYWLKMKIWYTVLSFEIEPVGKQNIVAGKDAISEWTLKNEITNYKDSLTLAEESIRLIPYEGGILVEDNVHVVLAAETAFANTVRKEIEKKWSQLIGAFRKSLGGDNK